MAFLRFSTGKVSNYHREYANRKYFSLRSQLRSKVHFSATVHIPRLNEKKNIQSRASIYLLELLVFFFSFFFGIAARLRSGTRSAASLANQRFDCSGPRWIRILLFPSVPVTRRKKNLTAIKISRCT